MADQHDLERALRTFDHRASPRVKEAAMGAFSQRESRGHVLWARRIPLPIAAAGVALAATVAFMVGQRVGDDPVHRQPETSVAAVPVTAEGATTVWAVAASDVLADRTAHASGLLGEYSPRSR